MCKSEKILFIDKIVSLFTRYCSDMSLYVRYWVACQFALESNFGKSNRALKTHNLCSMKIPQVRFSLNTASTGVFAVYDSDEDCVLDYLYWLAFNRFTFHQLQSLDLYRLRIKARNYCPDEDYIDKINKLYNQLNS